MRKAAALLCAIFLLPLPLCGQEVYWGTPEAVATSAPAKFIQSFSNENLGLVAWQEYQPGGGDTSLVYISLRLSGDGLDWEHAPRRIGPFPVKGKQVPLFSALADATNRIFVAVITEERVIAVFVSTDRGRTFAEQKRLPAPEILVAPVLSLSARNELLLFVGYLFGNQSNVLENNQGIYRARSADGQNWSAFTPFTQDSEKLIQPALPSHTVFNRRDFVVFQARRANTEFQLFLKTSGDGGNTWSAAVPLTESLGGLEGNPAVNVINQRPFLGASKNGLLLAWERSVYGRTPQLYGMTLAENGKPGKEVRFSGDNAEARSPRLIKIQERPFLLWFENQPNAPDQVFFAPFPDEGDRKRPPARNLSAVPGSSFYPQAVMVKGQASVFWQNQAGAVEKLFHLGPDRTVKAPVLIALDFPPNGSGRLGRLRVRVEVPDDPSGIKEIYYLAGRRKNAAVNEAQATAVGREEKSLDTSFSIEGEGTWYISAFARDYAGNVSPVGQLQFTRDTVAPGRVRFLSPEKDADGFFPSNTFTVTWEPPADEAVAGYSVKLEWLDADYRAPAVPAAQYPIPDEAITQAPAAIEYKNLENGLYALSVIAYDKAGNRGEAETLEFRLNHYDPVTYITTVSAERDAADRLRLTIMGRGFLAGGAVNEVVIDRDGQKPYDRAYRLADGQYQVGSDRIITGLDITEVEDGTYQIGVYHPVRGLFFSGKDALRIDASNVVTYGPFWEAARSPITDISRYLVSLSFTDIMLWLIVLALAVVFFLSARKIAVLAREAAHLRLEVGALIEGGDLSMPETKKKITALRRKGIGLRLKFTLLISVLVLLIVLIVALPISIYMIRNQQETLAKKLYKEVSIVLSGIVRGSTDYLLVEKSRVLVGENLENQFKNIPEVARYAVVTGPRFLKPGSGELDFSEAAQPDLTSLEHIWSAVGTDISSKTKSGQYTPVESEIKDDLTALIPDLARSINAQAREKVADLAKDIDVKRAEYDKYKFRTDEAGMRERDRRRSELDALEKQLKAEFEALSGEPRSFPAFDPQNLDLGVGSYLFYKPIVARLGSHDNYYWGLGRLGVSMDPIKSEIRASRELLVIETGVIGLIALALGIAGALVLASIIITPLRRLSQGVAFIRDTQDKSLLKDHLITLRTRDELRELADTVNQMTQGLVKAALANKELVIGQEVQKMFIPLESGPDGKKRTTGAAANAHVDIFGYYEGAKVVSGDYFDFKQLDDRHFAIIKCDVAGKGVAGSLIMIEVATLFLSHFKGWSLKKDGLKIDQLVYRINDMLEERGFKGRFAQLSLCLLDSSTGVCHVSHAGDKALHLYRRRTMTHETIALANTPAAGVFHSTMIPPQSGFRVEPQKLEPGDTLFLFTDGLEEAKRLFRDGTFAPMACAEPGLKDGESHGGTHVKGSESEELSLERFEAITAAVFSKGRFRLFKHHNPLAEEELVFDFSACQGTAEEAVLALAAVEKIFRIYPDRAATAEDVVRVDKKIDAFLERTFSAYRVYFRTRSERPEEPDYVFFSGLKEDEQYDDLTILAIRKK